MILLIMRLKVRVYPKLELIIANPYLQLCHPHVLWSTNEVPQRHSHKLTSRSTEDYLKG